MSVADAIVACPAVQIPAGFSFSLAAEGINQGRSGEALSSGQGIIRGPRVDARLNGQLARIILFEEQTVIA